MGVEARNVDILIVGGGLAGLQAALSATESQPSTRIVIADLGGCASTEIMGFCAPLAPGDSPGLFAADTLAAGAGANNQQLVQRLAEEAISTVSRIERLGLAFDRNPDGSYALLRPLGSRFPRVVHQGTTTGKEIIGKFRESLGENPNVEFRGSRIIKLFTDAGRICGAMGIENGQPACYSAKAVVLATGGAAGLFGFSTWSKTLQGSGYALALDAGAKLTGMNHVQFEPCVAVWPKECYGFPVITTLLFEGAKLRDRDGLDLLNGLPSLPSKKALVEIMAGARPCGHGGFHFDFSGVDKETFRRKYPEYWRKLKDHLNGIEVKPAAHTTLGGIVIDETCASGVEGLFAAGECAGGIHGADRIGGNAGLEVLVFGRIAGHSAAICAASATRSASVEAQCGEYLKFQNGKLGTSDSASWLQAIGDMLDSSPRERASAQMLLKSLKEKFKLNPPGDIEGLAVCEQALAVAELLVPARKKAG